jgi:hypothetical protein
MDMRYISATVRYDAGPMQKWLEIAGIANKA